MLPLGYGVVLRRNGMNLSDFGAAVAHLIKIWQAGTKPLSEGKLGLIFDPGDLLNRARRLVGNLPVIESTLMEHDLSMSLDDVIAEALLAKCQLPAVAICGVNKPMRSGRSTLMVMGWMI